MNTCAGKITSSSSCFAADTSSPPSRTFSPNSPNTAIAANTHLNLAHSSPSSPLQPLSTTTTPFSSQSYHHRADCEGMMRRHCPSMPTSGGHQASTGNLFTAAGLEAAAELHDLTSRNHGNIKPDVSTMYHHHVMQRQHHPSDMHDFLSGDPMSGSLPVALSASGTVGSDHGGHHGPGASAGQLHAPSALYGSHPHHGNTGNGRSDRRSQSDVQESFHGHSYADPFLVNGMTLSGLHHHATASQISAATAAAAAHQMQQTFHSQQHHHHPGHHTGHHPGFGNSPPLLNANDPGLIDADPRELEAFAERFKQRRIKLGVTQADVGRALANLKLPGVGSLSQSTICRFESLTLSHNNMVALKPILQAWLEAAEAQARKARAGNRGELESMNVLPSSDKKRKRTSIAAPEKRSLEAYFSVQPRPSGEKIAAIAEKLDLKKNVVRVWFCNQRQKQKRMKYSAVNQQNMG